MFCEKCGSQLPEHSKFCDACGNRITAQIQSAAGQQIQHKPKNSKVRIGSVIAGGIAIVMIIMSLLLISVIKPWISEECNMRKKSVRKIITDIESSETKETIPELSTEARLCFLDFVSNYPEIETFGELIDVLGPPDEIMPYREATCAYCYDNIKFGCLVSYYDYDGNVNFQVNNISNEKIWTMEVVEGGYLTEDIWVGMTFEELSKYFHFDLKHPETDETNGGGYTADASIHFGESVYSFTFKFDDYRPEAKSTNAFYWIN